MAWADWSSQIRGELSQAAFIHLFIKNKMFKKEIIKDKGCF